ncbi:hypothetical protein HBO10_29700 [Pseudomonas sp. WS 5503]|uniref:hypothetical protein n=1 Tax=Pseudomonadaceae TaxID=135621 RepID=UPI001473CDE1|nr:MULTISPECIES: hypothetical protein [Pseudomonadaceae]MBA1261555.1 hypothetical protein [Stutzerimonas stutzeri]MBF6043436.1 hypothetical protein [Pseudomonas mucoides]NMX83683.1 hypothetical protein [Pseudomonas sp. WS 5503]NNB23609.1 hypothetical protein [Pseudomonas fragi]WHT75571.1 hypothetical protein QMY54_00306 [Pseudomonas rhodesiae]
MNTPRTIPAAGLRFTKFAMERCLHVIYDSGEHYMPLDARQREEILALVANATRLTDEDAARLALIHCELNETISIVLDTLDSPLYALASDPNDLEHMLSTGHYAGVVWRVVGFLSDTPDEAIQLNVGTCEASVRQVLEAFESLVEAATAPVRLVADVTGGALHGIYAERPAEVAFISHHRDDLDEEQVREGYTATNGQPVAMWLQDSTGGEKIVVDHYFTELKKSAQRSAAA